MGIVRVTGVTIFPAQHFLKVIAMTLLADGFAQGCSGAAMLFQPGGGMGIDLVATVTRDLRDAPLEVAAVALRRALFLAILQDKGAMRVFIPPAWSVRVVVVALITARLAVSTLEIGAVTNLAKLFAPLLDGHPMFYCLRPIVIVGIGGVALCAGYSGDSPLEVAAVTLGGAAGLTVFQNSGPMLGGILPTLFMRIGGVTLKTAYVAVPTF